MLRNIYIYTYVYDNVRVAAAMLTKHKACHESSRCQGLEEDLYGLAIASVVACPTSTEGATDIQARSMCMFCSSDP